MSRKIVIEIEEGVYEYLMKSFQEAKRSNDNLTVEEFVKEIVSQYVSVRNQTGSLFNKMSKAMLENFDPEQLENMLNSLKNMGDIFGPIKDEDNEDSDDITKKNDQSETDHSPNISNKKS